MHYVFPLLSSDPGEEGDFPPAETSMMNDEDEEVEEVKRRTETGNRSKLSLCAAPLTPTEPPQIYLPLMDREAIDTGQSFRVFSAPVNQRKTPVVFISASVFDKHPKTYGTLLLLQIWDEVLSKVLLLKCSNKSKTFIGFLSFNSLRSRIYTAPSSRGRSSYGSETTDRHKSAPAN